MKTILLLVIACLFTVSCHKQTAPPAASPVTAPGVDSAQLAMTPNGIYPSAITVFINHVPMPVTAIRFNRGTASFNFSAKINCRK